MLIHEEPCNQMLIDSSINYHCSCRLHFYFPDITNIVLPLLLLLASSLFQFQTSDSSFVCLYYLYPDGLSNSNLWAEGVFGPKFWLYVQDPHHWQQQCRKNLLLVPLCWRLLHTGFCQYSGHRFQGEDHLQERQEDQITDLGKMEESTSWVWHHKHVSHEDSLQKIKII